MRPQPLPARPALLDDFGLDLALNASARAWGAEAARAQGSGGAPLSRAATELLAPQDALAVRVAGPAAAPLLAAMPSPSAAPIPETDAPPPEGPRVTTAVRVLATVPDTRLGEAEPKLAVTLDPALLERNEVNFTPSDTYFGGVVSSWHWDVLGDIETIWDDFTGAGVRVGVYDDGIQYDHPDLDGNYDTGGHVSVGGVVQDPHPSTGAPANHGTAVAGLIAAEANGAGSVGVAFGATLSGVAIFSGAANINNAPPTGFLEAADQMANFDVVNNSWGATNPIFAPSANRVATVARFENAVDTGRGGLGTIVVKSAGNAWDDGFEGNANGEEGNATRYTVTVGATGDDGDVSVYSCRGSNVLVSASGSAQPTFIGGVISTDRQGADGYNDGLNPSNPLPDADYTYFNGTSAAAPIVSGVAALMLDANADLGWRDVQTILAYSATHLGSAPGGAPSGREAFGWEFNGAANWNGGGLHFSEDYGYGQVNAYNAVRMAEVWSLFNGGAQTSANEATVSSSNSFDQALTDFTTVEYSFTYGGFNFDVEYIDVTLTLQHTWFSDLKLELIGPNGQVITLFDTSSAFSTYNAIADGGHTWTYGVNAARGENLDGTWYVRLTDGASGDSGMVTDVNLTFYGRNNGLGGANLANDVYHYTDEVVWALGLDGDRQTLSDADGGMDWLNMAALAGDVSLNLTAGTGGADYAGQRILDIAGGTTIENAVTGDGADLVVGNGAANELHGMRGADRLYGSAGDDALHGGAGDDFLHGGVGADALAGGDDYDTISYANSNARVIVRLWNQTATGGHATGDSLGGIEAVVGSSWNDILVGDNIGNVLDGGAGDDYLEGGWGGDAMTGGDGIDTLAFATSTVRVIARLYNNTASGGHANGDTFSGFENLIGSKHNDVLAGSTVANRLEGGLGDDYLDGREGDDTLIGDAGVDQMFGGAGADLMTGGVGGDTLDGGADADTLSYAGSNARVVVRLWNNTASGGHATGDVIANFEHLTGSDFNDILIGEAGANTLIGAVGDDYLDGMAGDDRLYGAGGVDQIFGKDGNDLIVGGGGADILDGGANADVLSYAGSNARVKVRLYNNTAEEGHAAGDVISNFENLIGSSYNDLLVGDAGWNGITGGAGDDILDGREGDDALVGGAGDDRHYGGAGADDFIFDGAWGADRIHDFDAGVAATDQIYLDSGRFTDFADVLANTADDGLGNTVISKAGVSIILEGVLKAQLAANDFVFFAPGAPLSGAPLADDPVASAGSMPADELKSGLPGRSLDLTGSDARVAPEVKDLPVWSDALVAPEPLALAPGPWMGGTAEFDRPMHRLVGVDHDWIW